MVRVAIYSRVSTDDQAREGFSLDAQEERLEAYCRAREWDAVATYVDDGYSGRDTRRPAYQRMMEERDRWDVALVMKMDRIHRNARNFMGMMDDLGSWGKNFVSATESLDTSTAMGRFVMDIIQRIAQLESEQIGERVYMGMAQKATSGPGILGFHSPLGYRLSDGQLRVDPDEAPVITTMFDLCLGGRSLEEISDELNRQGLQTKRKSTWRPVKVYRILHNPLYAGYLRWDGLLRRGDHEPLVSIDAFNRVQTTLRSRALAPGARGPPLALEA